MADPQIPELPTGAAPPIAPVPKAGKPLMTYLVVAVATILGGVVGTMVIAPKLVAARAQKEVAAEDGAKEDEKAPKEEKGPLFKMDNLIVNPAGSQGARFLMVSVAVATPSGEVAEQLRADEAVIRDVVIALLERKSMEMLARPGIRDSIKAELSDTISALTGHSGDKLKVYLPQFVIQ
jgi:flagellar protein FliL